MSKYVYFNENERFLLKINHIVNLDANVRSSLLTEHTLRFRK